MTKRPTVPPRATARDIGRGIMARIMGAEKFEKRERTRSSFNGDLQDFVEEVCFGRIWSRPGIDLKQRSIVNLAFLIALDRPNQLRSHIDNALNNGCTVEEIKEIMLQSAVYCGLPAANDAFRIAEEVMERRGLLS